MKLKREQFEKIPTTRSVQRNVDEKQTEIPLRNVKSETLPSKRRTGTNDAANKKREFGDYQTPKEFAALVCRLLKDVWRLAPSAVVEPTCGLGFFLESSLTFDAKEYYGIEIRPEYCRSCRERIVDPRVKIVESDVFSIETKSLIQDDSNVLVVGNPPWVPNSVLSTLGSSNRPPKKNVKGLRGFDATTGAGDFDICEAILLRLVDEYRDCEATLALLCKTTVARNVFEELSRRKIGCVGCDLVPFDAGKTFGVAASGCLFVLRFSKSASPIDRYNVRAFDDPRRIVASYRYANGRFYAEGSEMIDLFDGFSLFEWRQGVKHDCAAAMELTLRDGRLTNGRGEIADVEDDLVFPLAKGRLLKRPIANSFETFVLVTQKKIGAETASLESTAPRAWRYLQANRRAFEQRKSSIYRVAPPFAMFGVGEYSFAPFKVGIAGFHKEPSFSLLYSLDGKPVMTDDTSYFIGFDSFENAYVAVLLLNTERVRRFFSSVAFLDAKRPFTKKVLQRFDFLKATAVVSFDELLETEKRLSFDRRLVPELCEKFQSLLISKSQNLSKPRNDLDSAAS